MEIAGSNLHGTHFHDSNHHSEASGKHHFVVVSESSSSHNLPHSHVDRAEGSNLSPVCMAVGSKPKGLEHEQSASLHQSIPTSVSGYQDNGGPDIVVDKQMEENGLPEVHFL